MRTAQFKPRKQGKRWVLNIPATCSPDGKRSRKYFATRDEARTYAERLQIRIRNEGVGEPLSRMVQIDAAAAVAVLGDSYRMGILKEAAAALLERQRAESASVTFIRAVSAYVEAKSFRSEEHLASLSVLPGKFPTLANLKMCSITSLEIDEALSGLTPSARNLRLNLIRAVFNFAIKRGWAQSNPGTLLDIAHIPKKPVTTLTAAQVRGLFDAALDIDPGQCALLAVRLFAGIRPDESEKLTWGNVNLESGYITVPASVAKTRRARHIAMHPTLRAWLEWSEPVSNFIARPEGILDRLKAARIRAGLWPWPKDVLRHTFASAALASGWRDVSGLCLDMGHTDTTMLWEHYHNSMRQADAEAIFDVLPPRDVAKILRIVAA